ncbi:hypothetical protein OAA_13970 [Vibrio cyclitrophicus 1F175]|uniref:hypothetical protein n=1 Tax=Vibrio cyclitrophicus TaxID=47951 RepID=UPI000379A0A8|nr:hypothetical protein [Vibrio cyclitrophicus]OEF63587.1 hypothetical protein OAA_13970 [Vibrio cyclitrophicus 1F175]
MRHTNKSLLLVMIFLSQINIHPASAITLSDAIAQSKQITVPIGQKNPNAYGISPSVVKEPHTSNVVQKMNVLGNDARDGATSLAYCPPGFSLTGGGYILSWAIGGGAFNSPDRSYPEPQYNRWVVVGVSPSAARRGFQAVANCVKL